MNTARSIMLETMVVVVTTVMLMSAALYQGALRWAHARSRRS